MATLFSDSFNRADSATVDATNWTENPAADWAIVSNKVRSVNPLTTLITKVAAHAAVADCKVSYKRALTGSSWDTGVLVRTNGVGVTTTGYFLDPIGTGPASTMDIWRIDGNLTSDTQIGSTVGGLTLADGDTYALEVSGTGGTVTLRGYLNGVVVITVTDSSASRIVAAGQTGIINWNNTNDFDDFLVEDLGGGATSTITPTTGALTLAGNTPLMNAFTSVAIKEVFINEAGSPITNRTGISLLVWYGGSPNGSPNLSYSALTTDPAGTASWSIVPGTLVFGQAIFYVATDGGASLSQYTCARMVPTYS